MTASKAALLGLKTFRTRSADPARGSVPLWNMSKEHLSIAVHGNRIAGAVLCAQCLRTVLSIILKFCIPKEE